MHSLFPTHMPPDTPGRDLHCIKLWMNFLYKDLSRFTIQLWLFFLLFCFLSMGEDQKFDVSPMGSFASASGLWCLFPVMNNYVLIEEMVFCFQLWPTFTYILFWTLIVKCCFICAPNNEPFVAVFICFVGKLAELNGLPQPAASPMSSCGCV